MTAKIFVSILLSLAILSFILDNSSLTRGFLSDISGDVMNNFGNLDIKVGILKTAVKKDVMPIEIALENFEPKNVSLTAKTSEIYLVDARTNRVVIDGKNIGITPTLAGPMRIENFEGKMFFDSDNGVFSARGRSTKVFSDLFFMESERYFDFEGLFFAENVRLVNANVDKIKFDESTGAVVYNKSSSLWAFNDQLEIANFIGNVSFGKDGLVMKGSASSFAVSGEKTRIFVRA